MIRYLTDINAIMDRYRIDIDILRARKPREKHMKIGTFSQHEGGYTGWIKTAGLCLEAVMFSAVPVKQGSGPDFVIRCPT
jgi:hypothetical protein